MARGRGGFIGQDGLNAPDSPTGVSGTAGNASVSVAFTAPTDVGGSAITGYNVQSNNGDGSAASISNAIYNSKNFSVASQESTLLAFFIDDSGTRLFAVGYTNDTVYKYTLSTAWDISSASYDSKSFSVASQMTHPRALSFSSDGTKMYVGEYTTIYEYNLSTAWDVSTASYNSVSFSPSGQTSGLHEMLLSPDGTKMYITDINGGSIFQYTLSTAYDLSTASYASKSLSVSSQDSVPYGLAFNPDGTKLYLSGGNTYTVYQYNLTTAYDISTGAYSNSSFDASGQGANNQICLVFKTDGTKMYLGGLGNTIYEYLVPDYASSSPVTVTGLTNGTSYTFNVWAINSFGYSAPSDASGSVTPLSPQQEAFTTSGTYSWVAPAGVTSVSVLCIGGGGGATNQTLTNAAGNGGGGGGELRYKTSVSVTAGNSYTVVVGAGGAGGASDGSVTSAAGGNSTFNSTSCVANGGSAGPNNSSGGSGGSGGTGDGGGNGGAGGNGDGSNRPGGGGGAGGYSGTGGTGGTGSSSGTGQGGSDGSGGGGGGGNGGNASNLASGRGGGTALGGEGTSGAGAPYNQSFFFSGGIGSSQTGFTTGFGNGAGAIRGNPPYTASYAGVGGVGAVRIIYSTTGATRQYPSTNTGDIP